MTSKANAAKRRSSPSKKAKHMLIEIRGIDQQCNVSTSWIIGFDVTGITEIFFDTVAHSSSRDDHHEEMFVKNNQIIKKKCSMQVAETMLLRECSRAVTSLLKKKRSSSCVTAAVSSRPMSRHVHIK